MISTLLLLLQPIEITSSTYYTWVDPGFPFIRNTIVKEQSGSYNLCVRLLFQIKEIKRMYVLIYDFQHKTTFFPFQDD